MTEDRLRPRRGGRKREGAAKADYVAYFALDGDLEQRLDNVRGTMPRAAWMRATFMAQLEADELNGTAAGMTPQDNPYDGGMPFGLPRPDPYVRGSLIVPKNRAGSKRARAAVNVVADLRHIQVLSLASAGKSRAEICETTGYSRATVGWILRHELNKYKMATVQEYREFTLRKLLELMQVQQDTIDSPGYVTSATGNLVTGPDGEPLLDKTERTRSVTEMRKLIESMRREVGTDAPSQRHITQEQAQLDSTLKNLLAQLMIRPRALEDAVEAEVISDSGDDEAQDEGEEPGWEEPGGAGSDEAAGDEGGQQQQERGSEQADQL